MAKRLPGLRQHLRGPYSRFPFRVTRIESEVQAPNELEHKTEREVGHIVHSPNNKAKFERLEPENFPVEEDRWIGSFEKVRKKNIYMLL